MIRSGRRACAGLAVALCALAAPARADDAPCRRGITVTGVAQAAQAPDFAAVSIGVEAKGATAAAALDAASKAIEGVVALGRDLGVPASDIGTAAIVLEAVTRTVTQRDGSSREVPDGYRGTNRVSVWLADMARLGDLLRRSIEAGANRIESVTFGLNDPAAVEAALQVEAVKRARAQAAALAEAAGARLGALCTLTTGRTVQPMRMQAARSLEAPEPKRVPIESGTIESSAEVSATFAIAP